MTMAIAVLQTPSEMTVMVMRALLVNFDDVYDGEDVAWTGGYDEC